MSLKCPCMEIRKYLLEGNILREDKWKRKGINELFEEGKFLVTRGKQKLEKQQKEDIGEVFGHNWRRRTKEIKRRNYLRIKVFGPERRRRAEKKKEDSIGKVKYLVLRRDEEQRE